MLATLLILLLQIPDDPASALLTRYLSIRTDHPEHGTLWAANFWAQQARAYSLESIVWSIDRAEKCVNVVTRIPATSSATKRPILLLHHGDVVSANELEWQTPPFEPQWIRTQFDWVVHARGAIDNKGHGVVHWQALLNLLSKPRFRDIYFAMTCGEEISDPNGARAFVHFLIKPLSGFAYDLGTAEKLELAKVAEKFSNLPELEWVWNEGSFIDRSSFLPFWIAPVAVAQKGLWVGEVVAKGAAGHSALASSQTAHESLVAGLSKLYQSNRSIRKKFHLLQPEQVAFAQTVASTQSFFKWLLIRLWPRALFEFSDLESLIDSWWRALPVTASSQAINVVPSEASAILEYRFVGERTEAEIVATLQKTFGASLERVTTREYSPFRRDFFEGPEAEAFKDVLSSIPQTKVTAFLTPGITDSRFFRQAKVRAFDFVPFALTREEISAMHGANERLPHEAFLRAIDIETRILEKLVAE